MKQQYTSLTAQTSCFDEHEKWAWIKYAPLYKEFYDSMQQERSQLASEYDSKQITLDEFKTQFNSVKDQMYRNLNRKIADDEVARQESARETSQFLQDALLTAASVEQQHANADAARLQVMRNSMPRMQTTTCQPVLGQVQCTTYGY